MSTIRENDFKELKDLNIANKGGNKLILFQWKKMNLTSNIARLINKNLRNGIANIFPHFSL